MKKVVLLLLIMALVGGYYYYKGPKIYSTKSEKALASYQEGLEALMKFYVYEGEAAMTQAIEEDPEFPLPKLFIYRYKGREEAEKIYKSLIKELDSPENKWTEFEKRLVKLATNYTFKDDDILKVEIEKMFNDYNDQNEVFSLLLGRYQMLEKDNTKLLKYYEKLNKMYPNNVQVLNLLGYLYWRLGNETKGKEAFEKYIFIRPNEPNPYDSFGECYLNANNLEMAAEKFNKALAIAPDFKESRTKLATVLMHQGQLTKALEVINYLKSGEYSGIKWEYYSLREMIHYLKNDIKGMERVIEEVKSAIVEKRLIDDLNFRYYLLVGDIEKIKEYLPISNSTSDELQKQGYYTKYKVSSLFILEKRYEEAEKLLESIPDEVFENRANFKNDCIVNKIKVAIGKKDYDKALFLADKTLYHENLYWKMKIFNEKGDLEKAKSLAEEVLKAYRDADRDFIIVKEAEQYAK